MDHAALRPETRLTGLHYSSPVLLDNGQIHPGRGQPDYENLYDLMKLCNEAWENRGPDACIMSAITQYSGHTPGIAATTVAPRPFRGSGPPTLQVCSWPLAHTSPSQGQRGWQLLVFLPHSLWDSLSEVRDRLHIPGKMKTSRQPALPSPAMLTPADPSPPFCQHRSQQ